MKDIIRRIGEDLEVMIDKEMIEGIVLVAERIEEIEEIQVKTETGGEQGIQVKIEIGGEEEIQVKTETEGGKGIQVKKEIGGEKDQEVMIEEKVEDLSFIIHLINFLPTIKCLVFYLLKLNKLSLKCCPVSE